MCLLIPAVLMSIGTYLFKACSVSPLNTTPSFSGFPNSLTVDSDKGNLTLFCVLWIISVIYAFFLDRKWRLRQSRARISLLLRPVYIANRVGDNTATVINCTNAATIAVAEGATDVIYVGGIAGTNILGTIMGCINTGAISGNCYVGGVVGRNSNSIGIVVACSNKGIVTGSDRTGGIIGAYENSSKVYGSWTITTTESDTTIDGIGNTNINLTNIGCFSGDAATINSLALAHFPHGQSATFHCHPRTRLWGLQAVPQTLAKPNAHIGAPGKTVAIAEGSALSTDFPLWAERYQKMLPVGIILW